MRSTNVILFLSCCLFAATVHGQFVAHDDLVVTLEGQEVQFRVSDLTINDEIPRGGGQAELVVETWSDGLLTRQNDRFTYQPGNSFYGQDRFSYSLYRDGEISASATVTLWVSPAKVVVAGDWSGDGQRRIAWFESGKARLLTCPDVSISAACTALDLPSQTVGWVPVAGDFTGDQVDDVALYDPASGAVHLVDPAAPSQLPLLAQGWPGEVPVAGDWNGDGVDSLAFYRAADNRFRQVATLSDMSSYVEFHYGPAWPEDYDLFPLAGDWDSDGRDTVSLYIREDGLYLSNQPETGVVHYHEKVSKGPAAISGPWASDQVMFFDAWYDRIFAQPLTLSDAVASAVDFPRPPPDEGG